MFQTRKKITKTLVEARASFSSIDENITGITELLKNKHFISLTNDVKEFDIMYDLNKEFYRELSMYIVVGKEKLECVKTYELPELNQKSSR